MIHSRTWALVLFSALLPGASQAQVVINEIMYRPGTGPQARDTEYIELLNPGPSVVDLTPYRFEEGIQYEFPQGTQLAPGQYLVLCRNKNDFAAAHPRVTNMLGPYAGSLDNNGEKLTLVRLYYGNKTVVDSVEYNDRGEWPKAPDGNGPSLELVHPGFDNQYPEAWAPSAPGGTPGADNSVFQKDPAPLITDVLHVPALPQPLSALTIIARVLGHDARPINVTLKYREDKERPQDYISMRMDDDGAHGDARPRDGIYGARVRGLGDGGVLDFQIEAVRAAGGSAVLAPPGVPQQTFLCCFGRPLDPRREYPEYHILLTHANRKELETRDVRSRDPLDGTLITSEQQVFYNCGVRYRGSSARVHYAGPKSFRVNIRQGGDIDGTDKLNFNAVNPLLQHLGMELMRTNGVPAPDTQLCRVWLNGDLLTQKGEKWLNDAKGGIYVRMERVDDDFLRKHYPDQDIGNLYEGASRDSDLRWLGNSAESYTSAGYERHTNAGTNDWQDLAELATRLNDTSNPNYAANLAARVNVMEWVSFFATHILLNNNETCIATSNGDDYFLYCQPTNGLFDLIPWDLDSVIDLSGNGALDKQAKPFARTTNQSIWMTRPQTPRGFIRHPQIAPLFVNRILEILDTAYSPREMGPRLAALGSALSMGYRKELEKSILARHEFIRKQINYRLTAKVNGSPVRPGGVANANGLSASLTGTAPQPNVFRVMLNDAPAQWNPAQATWSRRDFPLEPGINRITIRALDADGNPVKDMQITITARGARDKTVQTR
ncbi:MAG: CotH kinase family protein [Kiritimatiellae bacterium]|nr:CotH kinase family protein [Kiritimatiellia bacterium]